MTDYVKTKVGFETAQLQAEINGNVGIVPSCTSISSNGTSLTITFAAALSVGEETELDVVIAAHVLDTELVDVAIMPFSPTAGKRLAVHSSSMPTSDGKTFYDVFTSAGDDLVTHSTGDGDVLEFDMEVGVASTSIDCKFDTALGKVYLHGGKVSYEGGSSGDYAEAFVVAEPTPVYQAGSGDTLAVDVDGWITYVGDPAGTHSFAGTPSLILRSFSGDGDWDYNGVSLTPNFSQEGQYKINTNEYLVHKYLNRLPCHGSSYGYVGLETLEAAFIPPGYFIRVCVNNVSNTSWYAHAIISLYRETTMSN